MADLFSTGDVAWYGAIVATLGLAFSIWKWSFERARLRVRIVPTVYDDGGYDKVELTEHGEVKTMRFYYHIEVTNVGERPTTIMGASATTKANGLLEKASAKLARFDGVMGIANQGFTPHYGKTVPHVLGSGEVWSCRIPVDSITTLLQAGTPKLELTATCWNSSHLYRFPMPKGTPRDL